MTRTHSNRRATLVGLCALLCCPLVGCGESKPPAPQPASKVIEKQLDSANPKDRLEGAKEAEKIYGNGDASDKAVSPPAPANHSDYK